MKPKHLLLVLFATVSASIIILVQNGNISALKGLLILFFSALTLSGGLLFYYSYNLKALFQKIRDVRGVKAEKKVLENKNIFDSIDAEISALARDRDNELEQMTKLENYRKEFLGNVSHELKTPIFNIQGYLHTLLDGGLDDPNINRDYLKRAANSTERMINIVEDLQAISLLEVGELELDMERFDINELVNEIFLSQEMKAREKKISLSTKPGIGSPAWVMADRQRIRQVLTNLITNSIRYGKEGGETKVKISDVGDKLMVEVADTGLGIPEKHLSRVFERFYRVDKGRSREQGGTGLGLAIVKHIIEAHRQTISVISTEGVGSVFTFTLQKAV